MINWHGVFNSPLFRFLKVSVSAVRQMHMKATCFFHMFNPAVHFTSSCFSFLHPLMYFSKPLIKFLLIMIAQDISFKGTGSDEGLPQLDCQYKSIDKFNLRSQIYELTGSV